LKSILSLFLIFSFTFNSLAQDNKEIELKVKDTFPYKDKINPLAPSKAAFYSAILPGLGQAYNKQYWKIPLVYIGLGTTMYFVLDNDKNYNSFRDAYKSRLEGNTNDEYFGRYSSETLERGMKNAKRNRDLSILLTLGVYILNIVEANVSAHLMQFNVNDDLTIAPDIYQSPIDATSLNLGLTLSYKLN
jgi:Family of unknown function (DUF5683)